MSSALPIEHDETKPDTAEQRENATWPRERITRPLSPTDMQVQDARPHGDIGAGLNARPPLTGVITFMFTDVEGGTSLWERVPDAANHALMRHDALIETCVTNHRGLLVRPRGEGDGRFAVFDQAIDAVACAAAIQQAL